MQVSVKATSQHIYTLSSGNIEITATELEKKRYYKIKNLISPIISILCQSFSVELSKMCHGNIIYMARLLEHIELIDIDVRVM